MKCSSRAPKLSRCHTNSEQTQVSQNLPGSPLQVEVLKGIWACLPRKARVGKRGTFSEWLFIDLTNKREETEQLS